MKEFLTDNWPFILVATFIIILVWSVMKVSKRDDNDKWEQEDEDDNIPIDFDCENIKHLN